MIGIIGQKLGMTQVFNEQGQQIPVTVVEAPPNPVLGVTDKDKAGFASVQLGYGQQRSARESKKGEHKPQRGRSLATRRRRDWSMRRRCCARSVSMMRQARTRRFRRSPLATS